MTRTTNARIAGFTFLFYIAAGIASMVLFGRATTGEGIAAKLAGIAQHATDVRIVVLLSLLTCFAALVLAVTLYWITRDEDHELAVLALSCRVGEGVLNVISIIATLDCSGSRRPPEWMRRTLRQCTHSPRSFARCQAGTCSSARLSSPWAARSSPTSSCAAGWSPSHWLGWASSRRSYSSWSFPCSSSDSSQARSAGSCGYRCSCSN